MCLPPDVVSTIKRNASICLYLHVNWAYSGSKFQQESDTAPEIWALEVATNTQCEDMEEQCLIFKQ